MKRKLLFFILLLLIISILPVHAKPETYDRNTLEDYGVRKNWTINENNLNNVLRTYAVNASEKIYDFSEILTEDEEKQLREKIDAFEKKHHMELIILTDSYEYPESLKNSCYSDTMADKEIFRINDEYAADFYDYNDFGMDYNMSGILIFRNTAIDPCFDAMYYDMYTFGNAQLYFDQSRYDTVLDAIFDDLHSDNYLSGFESFISKVDSYVTSGKPSALEQYYVDESGYLQKLPATYHVPWGMCAAVSGVITLIVILILVHKNKMVHKAVQASAYLAKDTVHITNRQDVFVTSHVTSYTESDSSSGGGGFSSHGGSSGGGHSSGGGRHG
ncbi:MAG: TPM domain-containing protein [Bacilli bacterium]|nr:TPM domain-containing protein [Bacilli bacterium]